MNNKLDNLYIQKRFGISKSLFTLGVRLVHFSHFYEWYLFLR